MTRSSILGIAVISGMACAAGWALTAARFLNWHSAAALWCALAALLTAAAVSGVVARIAPRSRSASVALCVGAFAIGLLLIPLAEYVVLYALSGATD